MKSTPTATALKNPPPRGPKDLQSKPAPANAESLVREALDDVALVIGSAAACKRIEEGLVWTLMQRMDRIRVRLFRNLKGLPPDLTFQRSLANPPRIHAAVEEFLLRNQARLGE